MTLSDAGITARPPGAAQAAATGSGVTAVGPCEHADGVGCRVIAIRGRQVDHLEVGADLLEERERPLRPRVVEGHERVVEDEWRTAIPGHEPDEPDPGREVDEIERALAEARDIHPIIPFRREDLDAEVLVVHLDAPVATGGPPLDVGDHPLLEIPRRGPDRRPLGGLEGPERRVVDPGAALHGGELLGPKLGLLGVSRDLLRVRGVLLDPGPGVGLLVTHDAQGAVRVDDFDLEALAGTRLMGDRSQLLESARFLLDLVGRGVPQLGQRLAGFPADAALRAAPVAEGCR